MQITWGPDDDELMETVAMWRHAEPVHAVLRPHGDRQQLHVAIAAHHQAGRPAAEDEVLLSVRAAAALLPLALACTWGCTMRLSQGQVQD